MTSPDNRATTSRRSSTRRNTRIEVTNFGPVAKGAVDLRPLTVFVGRSNSGKTYVASLIYALHRTFAGFPPFPMVYRSSGPSFGVQHDWSYFGVESPPTVADLSEDEIHHVRSKLERRDGPLTFSDFPQRLCSAVRSHVEASTSFEHDLLADLKRCFDITSVSALRSWGQPDGMTVATVVSQGNRELWRTDLGVSEGDGTVSVRIEAEDFVLVPEDDKPTRDRLMDAIDRKGSRVFDDILDAAMAGREPDAYYLPASRGGIMECRRLIESGLVERSTRWRLEHPRELPTISGIVADFLQRLILYDEGGAVDSPGLDLARDLERRVLLGQVRYTGRSKEGVEFEYRPENATRSIRLSRSSSMVSELAPVVLMLRGFVKSHDLLILEEPESHLHPHAQMKMAESLAAIVRAGVQVLVTTHSDWLLQEIGNLLREGELRESPVDPSSGSSRRSWLNQDEVGVWLFRDDGPGVGTTVKEIPFDPSEGVDPAEYEEVERELYNRSADLQNRLVGRSVAAREHE